MTSNWRWNYCHVDGKRCNFVVCVVVCCWLIIVLDPSTVVDARKNPGTALKDALFLNRTYDSAERPVNHYNDAIHVSIDITLSHLVNVYEKDQYIHIQIWIRLTWNDSYISWDPAEHDGIKRIFVPVTDIWTPDIVIANEVGVETGFDRTDFLAQVFSNGFVRWAYAKIIQTACKMDVSEFPFDKQECPLVFTSWAYDSNHLILENKTAHAERAQYKDHGEWKLTHFPAQHNKESNFACCGNATFFYNVTYTIGIQRRSMYYTYTLIFPCICLTFLCLTGFLLPVQSGERISMNLMILLAQVVLLLHIFDNMPAQSEVIPVIGVYVGACIILISVSTVLNIFVLYIYFRGTRGRRMPQWMRRYILHTGAYVMCYRSMLAAEKSAHEGQKQERRISTALRSYTMLAPSLSTIPRPSSTPSTTPVNATCQSAYRRASHTTATPTFDGHREHQHASQGSYNNRGNIQFKAFSAEDYAYPDSDLLKVKLRNSKFAEGEIFNEWKVLSFVLDRFFFIAYFIITLILTVHILA